MAPGTQATSTDGPDVDPHAPLRDDVRLLGDLLGDVIVDQEGQEVLDLVAAVREAAQDARNGDADAARRLHGLLAELDGPTTKSVARAFLHFLALANIAEQHHRVRRRRAHARQASSGPQRGSVEDTLARLAGANIERGAIEQAVKGLEIELVLTAHPTQTTRRTLLLKHLRVEGFLETLDRPDLTPRERAETTDALRRELSSMWATAEIRHTRPTPEDEARGGFAIIEQVLWDALPEHLRELDRCVQAAGGGPLGPDVVPFRFSSWMGGDRDGNPNVTPETTHRVVALGRWMAAELFLRDLDGLRATLSMTDATPELVEEAGDAEAPYRALLRTMRARLKATQEAAERELDYDAPRTADVQPYEEAGTFGAHLRLIDASLRATGHGTIADGELLDTLRRFGCFGLHLVGLDIRQEASKHRAAMDAVAHAMGVKGLEVADDTARCATLTNIMASLEPFGQPDAVERALERTPPEVADVLRTMTMIATLPRDSLRSYVISMAAQASDVLDVLTLQKVAGIEPPLRVVPLFETLADLERAPSVIERLLSEPAFKAHTGAELEVMIGYSDSAKDAGVLSAAWALYRAQEGLAALADAHGLRLTVFHGRGGSVGRGGGPAHAAIAALPPGSVRGRLRVTEQGEVIQARYGSRGIALRSLELYVSAVLEATLVPGSEPVARWRDEMAKIAGASEAAYRATLADPDFVPYFRTATPERELGALKIGSRPAKRGGADDLASLRAIPWVFAWMQNRLIVPGWLGVGEGLRAGDAATVREMVASWPFFQATVDLVEMGLAKADLGVARAYHDALVPDALRPVGERLFERFEDTVTAVLEVTGHARLLAHNPVLRRSIDVRNPYVDPLNLVQIALLRRTRAGHPFGTGWQDGLELTMNGIAQGMRNTG